jgi:hypothetical protein
VLVEWRLVSCRIGYLPNSMEECGLRFGYCKLNRARIVNIYSK